MWEPGDGNTTSSNSSGSAASRGLLLLTAVFGACLILYKAWGPLLLITCALVLVVHTCYSLLVNDSLLPPHTLVLLRYARQIALELVQTLRLLSVIGIRKGKKLARYLKELWEERQRRASLAASAATHEEEDMNGRHKNVYRLSTTGADLAEQVSPIGNDRYHFALNGAHNVARTSTPLPKGDTWKKDGQPNGQIGLFTPINAVASKKMPAVRSENRQPNALGIPRDETLYSPKGSPWGNSISPKMKEKGSGVRTVQTVAGPLLASTRYNIDPKVYTDVSSPGLTSRLTKYASEANNKLTHQSQYGTGQFPKVNLNALSAPLLSPKVARARIPVTVRIAPPEMMNYAPSESQAASTSQEKHQISQAASISQEKHQFLSTSTSDQPKETKSCPSVAQVLKEISLKRHASREDITLDIAKKQRTERISEGQLENLEEMMQKRAREESITSEEDSSPQSKINERPLKRPKASSCHDILNSLSSSINVFSGVKRKAMDTSRCNTPDIEKHFKPSSKSPNRSNSFTGQTSGEVARSKEQLNVKVPIANASGEPHTQKVPEKSPEMLKDKEHSYENIRTTQESVKTLHLPSTPRIPKERPVPPKAEKLTDKLFMRAEPQVRENLKNYINEQESVESKFITDDKDEIKKQDIDNMRQNKLKSMFEAISGKSANKIDPDVVIHAEEIVPLSSSGYTSLNSGTTTTTVNTSPITTTIVPILKTDSEAKSPNTKHVTFNLPKSSSLLGSSLSSTTSNPQSLSSFTNKDTSKPAVESRPPNTVAPSFGSFSSTSTTSSSGNFNFGSNAPNTSVSSSKPSAVQSTTSGFSFPTSTAAISTPADTKSASILTTIPKTGAFPPIGQRSISDGFIGAKNVTVSPTMFLAASAQTTPTTATGPSIAPSSFGTNAATSAPSIAQTSAASSGGFSFGSTLAKSPTSTSIAQPKTTTTTLPAFGSEKKESTTGFSFGAPNPTSSLAASTTATNQPPSIFGSTSSTSSPMFSAGNPSAAASSAAPTTSASPMFSFNSAGNKPAAGGFSFGGASTAGAVTAAPANTTTSAFGGPSPTPASSVASKFAPPISSTAMGTPGVIAPKPSFGTSTSLFAAPSSTPSSLFSAPSASSATSMFKSPTSSTMAAATPPATSSIFGAPSASPGFGTPSTTVATPTSSLFGNNPAPGTTTTPTLFGNNPAAATTTSTPSMFGNNATTTSSVPSLFSNVAAIATSSVSPFGAATTQQQHQQQQQQPQQQSGIFSGGNATTASPATSSIFGSTTGATASSGLFSGAASSGTSMAPPASSSNTPTGIFGQTQQPASLSFGSTAPAFGSTTAPSVFGAPSSSAPGTSAFGAPSSTTGGLPSFGTIKPSPQFGAPTASAAAPTNAPGSSIFGSASGGGFGAPATGAAPAFGSTPASASGFGAPSASNAAPSFGATNPPAFGSTTSSPFGAQPTTTATPTLFGSAAPAPSGAPSTGASFSFGGSQPQQQPQQPQQQQQPQQPTASFAFGGAAPAAPAASGGMFQFGTASSAPKPAGFNFNAPAAAPQMNFTGAAPGGAAPAFNAPGGPAPAFNAPPANMFSIGSGGSSTPRPRNSRTRRQR